MSDRNQCLKENFIHFVKQLNLPSLSCQLTPKEVGLTPSALVDLFETQVTSRHLDLHSRVMQKQGQSFYTIGSSGHEGNSAIAKAFRANDMAFLHYRSGAFTLQRSKQVDGQTAIYDMLLSFAAAKDDPISGGRHKVLGSKALSIPPQTSTIASHLPKAMGAAFSIGLAKRLGHQGEMPNDSVIICSFGDASSNHSTAQGAINSAAWAAFQSIPMPIVFVCEDNGIGISTSTPHGWIEANYKNKAGLTYLTCDGLNLLDTYRVSQQAANLAREKQQPVFLHVKLIRLLGHAGSDAEFVYRKQATIEANEQNDPLLHSAKILLDNHILTVDEIIDLYENMAERIEKIAEEVVKKPRLQNANEVMESIVPPSIESLPNLVSETKRQALFQHEKHNLTKPQHLAKLINWTLLDLMAQHENVVLLGEDIAKKGGVYNVTTKLVERFGKNRVMNTLLDEQSILGGAIGLAHNGFVPIPEIQFLAYVHNAEDQIRGEAATLSFFSKGQYTNPMVIRIAGLAYQRGFGGHFHNDNSFAVFRDIPGLIIACPSNGADAVKLLRTSVKLAKEQQRVVVFLEPIALYMTKDLHQEGDGLWTFEYPAPAQQSVDAATHDLATNISKENNASEENDLAVAVHGDGTDLCILTYGNGYYLSRQAEKELVKKGIECRVVDLRWLAPLDERGIIAQAQACKKVLIVDECRKTGSISEAILALLCEKSTNDAHAVQRLCAQDSFIPLGSAAYHVLPSKEDIVKIASEMCLTSTKAHAKAKA
ncbi:dehydrogenase E1 component subunit alpha/beta [Thalassotalea castellviae]|uniref:3-methyl-2-oxobutanoate dehydrogenase (2-methylpropanoyl-transferring) n=1 Tax=Thalassotalea castellviae TaxID=3075612 RepID=A0ABU2ZZ03_9GAMM|nr:thiamine pyrophosphate-dependent enzyme [Thalassotalea sp. W431]MDT0602925.1 thiamine pyrophosphate-dependent enzyme [Thalassotalea sp. W431]